MRGLIARPAGKTAARVTHITVRTMSPECGKCLRLRDQNSKRFDLDLVPAAALRVIQPIIRLAHQHGEFRGFLAPKSANSETRGHGDAFAARRNSSPPIRPLRSEARVCSFSILATPHRTWSPAS